MLQMMRMSVVTVGVLVVALLAVTANAEALQLQTDSSMTGEQQTLPDGIDCFLRFDISYPHFQAL
jgi:hypothetical protein